MRHCNHPTADTTRLWSPPGTDLRPKGAAGPEHGNPREGGVFSLPLSDFVDQFSGLAFEVAPVARPDAGRNPGAERER